MNESETGRLYSIRIHVHLNIRRFLRETCVLNFINLKRFKNPPKRSSRALNYNYCVSN